MAELLFKKEVELNENGIFGQAFKENLLAYAQVVQNIIIIEPGTYPNHPDLGVGIERYLHEHFTTALKNEISTKINNQISKFAPVAKSLTSVKVEFIKKILYINIEISSTDNEEDIVSFSILYGIQQQTNLLKSRLII